MVINMTMRYLAIFITLISCNYRDESQFNLEGPWYLVRQDSVYEENVFRDDRVWAYDENFGEIQYGYELTNDSLSFIAPNGELSLTGQLQYIGKDEFLFVSDLFQLHYYRLNLDVDLMQLLNGDSETLEQYVIGLRDRKHKWENKRYSRGE